MLLSVDISQSISTDLSPVGSNCTKAEIVLDVKYTHTHTYIYIYIYVCVCVCVCTLRLYIYI